MWTLTRTSPLEGRALSMDSVKRGNEHLYPDGPALDWGI